MRVLVLIVPLIVYAVARLGQFMAGLHEGYLGLSGSYMASLGPEIGGSGIDAFVVGAVAAVLASRFAREEEFALYKRTLRRRRELERTLDLEEATVRWNTRLPLWGFTVRGKPVCEKILVRADFVGPGSTPRLATLIDMRFDGCIIKSSRFGSVRGGCKFDGCEFEKCKIVATDFRRATFSGRSGSPIFTDVVLRRCKFDRAKFIDLTIEDVTLGGTTFWGSEFENSRMPDGVFRQLDELGAIERLAPGRFRVKSWLELLSRPSWRLIYYRLKQAVSVV